MEDGANVPDRVDEAGESTVEIVSIPDEFGTIVMGNEGDIEEFAQAWDRAGGEHVVELSVGDVAPVLRAVPQLGAKAQVVRYLLGPTLWRQAEAPKPGTLVTYNRITRSTSTGLRVGDRANRGTVRIATARKWTRRAGGSTRCCAPPLMWQQTT
jgi:hypothetical protein